MLTQRHTDPTPGRSRWYLVLVASLAIALVCALVWRFTTTATDGPTVTPRGELEPNEKAVIALFKNSSPSVVNITTLDVVRSGWSMNTEQVPRGSGTGFLWGTQGHVVTNYHVIKGANAATVTLNSHTTWTAKLVGVAPDKDLAVLKIEPKEPLVPIKLGTSYDLQVGQSVYAIGNPFGLDHTLTTGVISGLGRETQGVTGRPITGMIQTDAAINPGNSGGPLLDSSGRLIGVNTQIVSTSGASAGIGFAVPVDTVHRIVPQIIEHGVYHPPILGIRLIEDHMARKIGLENKGVVVAKVARGSGAHRAGVRGMTWTKRGVSLGDIIVGLDDHKIRNVNDLFKALDRYRPSDTVVLEIIRDGATINLKVQLQQRSR